MADLTFNPSERDMANLKSLAKRYGVSANAMAKTLLHLAMPIAPEILAREARLAHEDAVREVPVEEEPA